MTGSVDPGDKSATAAPISGSAAVLSSGVVLAAAQCTVQRCGGCEKAAPKFLASSGHHPTLCGHKGWVPCQSQHGRAWEPSCWPRPTGPRGTVLGTVPWCAVRTSLRLCTCAYPSCRWSAGNACTRPNSRPKEAAGHAKAVKVEEQPAAVSSQPTSQQQQPRGQLEADGLGALGSGRLSAAGGGNSSLAWSSLASNFSNISTTIRWLSSSEFLVRASASLLSAFFSAP